MHFLIPNSKMVKYYSKGYIINDNDKSIYFYNSVILFLLVLMPSIIIMIDES